MTIDPDIQAAFSAAPPAAASTAPVDDDIKEAFSETSKTGSPIDLNKEDLPSILWHGGKQLAGSAAHGIGTLVDVATGTAPGQGSHAERFASPFATEPTLQDEEQRRMSEGVSKGYDTAFGTGPLATTLKERVPQAAEAIGTVTAPLGIKGAGTEAASSTDALIAKAKVGSSRSIGNALDAVREQVGPDVTSTHPVEHGDTLIEAYAAKDADAQAAISAKYQALKDANGGNFPVNGQQFVTNADKALSANMKRPFLPSGVQSTLEEFRDGSQPMTFENFENLRTTLGAEARKAARSGDGNTEAAINLVREQLESLPMTGESAQVKALADQARSAAKARFDALRADPAYKAAVTGSVPPDRFVQKFITGPSATRDGVAQMRANLADNPLATQTMGVAAVDHLRGVSGIDVGSDFRQGAFNKQLGSLGPRLEALVDPKTLGQLQTLGQAPGYGLLRRGAAAVLPSLTTAAGAKVAGPLGAMAGRNIGERAAERIVPP